MAVELYGTATEHTSTALTFTRGGPVQVAAVGVHHTTSPDTVPAVEGFTTVQLVDGVTSPDDPLAQDGVIDVVALIGPAVGADLALPPGTYYRWILVQTQPIGVRPGEDVIRQAPDTITVLRGGTPWTSPLWLWAIPAGSFAVLDGLAVFQQAEGGRATP